MTNQMTAVVHRADGTIDRYPLVPSDEADLEPIAKAVSVKCAKCGKFRSASEDYTPDGNGNTSDTCDRCHADAATKARRMPPPEVSDVMRKAAVTLDVPCLAIAADGEEETTIAKALGIDELAKAEAKRAEWAQAVKTIDEKLIPLRRQIKLDIIARHAEKSAARAVALVKAEVTRRETEQLRKDIAATEAETAKVKRRTREKQAYLAATQAEIAKAIADQAKQSAQVEAFIVSTSAKIDQMMARASAGAVQVQCQQDAEARAVAAREGRERDELLWKAGVTQDPIVRSVLLARANGESVDD